MHVPIKGPERTEPATEEEHRVCAAPRVYAPLTRSEGEYTTLTKRGAWAAREGDLVGPLVGTVGDLVVGGVGEIVGFAVDTVGDFVGDCVGLDVLGDLEGVWEGERDGDREGDLLGDLEGMRDGRAVGAIVGDVVGTDEGGVGAVGVVGDFVGTKVPRTPWQVHRKLESTSQLTLANAVAADWSVNGHAPTAPIAVRLENELSVELAHELELSYAPPGSANVKNEPSHTPAELSETSKSESRNIAPVDARRTPELEYTASPKLRAFQRLVTTPLTLEATKALGVEHGPTAEPGTAAARSTQTASAAAWV